MIFESQNNEQITLTLISRMDTRVIDYWKELKSHDQFDEIPPMEDIVEKYIKEWVPSDSHIVSPKIISSLLTSIKTEKRGIRRRIKARLMKDEAAYDSSTFQKYLEALDDNDRYIFACPFIYQYTRKTETDCLLMEIQINLLKILAEKKGNVNNLYDIGNINSKIPLKPQRESMVVLPIETPEATIMLEGQSLLQDEKLYGAKYYSDEHNDYEFTISASPEQLEVAKITENEEGALELRPNVVPSVKLDDLHRILFNYAVELPNFLTEHKIELRRADLLHELYPDVVLSGIHYRQFNKDIQIMTSLRFKVKDKATGELREAESYIAKYMAVPEHNPDGTEKPDVKCVFFMGESFVKGVIDYREGTNRPIRVSKKIRESVYNPIARELLFPLKEIRTELSVKWWDTHDADEQPDETAFTQIVNLDDINNVYLGDTVEERLDNFETALDDLQKQGIYIREFMVNRESRRAVIIFVPVNRKELLEQAKGDVNVHATDSLY